MLNPLPYRFVILLFLSLGICHAELAGQAQDKGTFSGIFQCNGNAFIEDEKLGATGTPQYDDNLFGIESWLDLKYRIKGFEVGVRADFFHNSNLLNPTSAYSDIGLGRVYVNQEIGRFHITGGFIYDQIGSGVIFKAYEERALLIDNALVGGRVRYDLKENWQIMAIGGKQKNLFSLYDSWLYGGRVEGYLTTSSDSNGWFFTPGAGLMVKKFSDEQVDELEDVIGTYTPEDRTAEIPYYTYAMTVYNTLQKGAFSWYIELAGKTDDTFFDPFEDRLLWTGEGTQGQFVVLPGYVVYNAINFAKDGLGISLEHKYTSDFTFRADPFVTLNRGMVNFLPPMSRLNTYRLTGRYVPATQELGENAIQMDVTYRPNRKMNYLLNASYIDDNSGMPLYREVYTEFSFKKPRKSILVAGLQYQWYNQQIYEGKPGVEPVQTVIPYVDYLFILSRQISLRIETQYMYTKQDFGSWLYGLAELSISPHWSFELSDMWNVDPFVDENGKTKNGKLHFPTVGATYTLNSNRFSLRYVKQVEGVVCSGGICRFEPAFSGVRIQISSQF